MKIPLRTIPIVLLRIIWEFPQNLVGLFLLARTIRTKQIVEQRFEKNSLFVGTQTLSISLGLIIFYQTGPGSYLDLGDRIRSHEYGHAIQSMITGPFYLIAIGIPSIARLFYAMQYYRRHRTAWTGYFDGYPENWADRLGDRRY